MKDYDDLARFRRKSGNTHFRLRRINEPSPSTGRGAATRPETPEAAAERPPRGQPMVSEAGPGAVAAEQRAAQAPVLALATTESDLRARRAQLAGLFCRPEPLPAGRPGASGTLLAPLLQRIAEQARDR